MKSPYRDEDEYLEDLLERADREENVFCEEISRRRKATKAIPNTLQQRGMLTPRPRYEKDALRAEFFRQVFDTTPYFNEKAGEMVDPRMRRRPDIYDLGSFHLMPVCEDYLLAIPPCMRLLEPAEIRTPVPEKGKRILRDAMESGLFEEFIFIQPTGRMNAEGTVLAGSSQGWCVPLYRWRTKPSGALPIDS